MEKLGKDWITEGLIDFEHKKYMLLAYLQYVKRNFDETKLYPSLSELITHYQDTLSFQRRKDLLKTGFPKEISRIDIEKLKIVYEQLAEDSELIEQLEEIVAYALPKMKDTLDFGKEMYEHIASEITIEPIGLIPLYKEEGYLLMEFGNSKLTNVYQYKISKFSMSGHGYRSIYLEFLDSIKRGIGDTFEGIKMKLVNAYKTLPNPATFLINGEKEYPQNETLMPITKRMLLQTVKHYEQ